MVRLKLTIWARRNSKWGEPNWFVGVVFRVSTMVIIVVRSLSFGVVAISLILVIASSAIDSITATIPMAVWLDKKTTLTATLACLKITIGVPVWQRISQVVRYS